MNRNRSGTRQTHSRDIINTLLILFSRSVLQVRDPHFTLQFMACTLCAFASSNGEKTSVLNLQYGPQTWLVRGISHSHQHRTVKDEQILLLWHNPRLFFSKRE